MTMFDTVKQEVMSEYHSGMRQTELANKHGVSQQTISRLLSKKNNCSGLTLDVVQRMFPLATISLYGRKGTVNTQNVVHGANYGTMAGVVESRSADSYRKEAVERMVGLDIPGDALKSVLKLLLEIPV